MQRCRDAEEDIRMKSFYSTQRHKGTKTQSVKSEIISILKVRQSIY